MKTALVSWKKPLTHAGIGPIGMWFCVAFHLGHAFGFGVTPQDMAVEVSAVVQPSPAQIMLVWPADKRVTSYIISRGPFGTGLSDANHYVWLAEIPGMATNFMDSAAEPGKIYDYQITKYFFDSGKLLTAKGLISAGIEIPLVDQRGKVILMVDNSFTTALAPELAQLEEDLVGDGWMVLRHDVSRNDDPHTVWQWIKADHDADPFGVKAVFLFGRVPRVMVRLTAPPDGHPDDVDWATDTAYGILSGEVATNVSLLSSLTKTDVQVGRVDLSDLLAFAPLTETDLLRQYLHKDHNFRHQLMTAPRRALVADRLGFLSGDLAPATAGWQNFSPLFGADNVVAGEWLPTLTQQSYLWAFGCAPGGPTIADGLVSTSDYATNEVQAVFTMLYGSYFENWMFTNDLLRAVIAGKTYGLASVGADTLYPRYIYMGLGTTIGSCLPYGFNLMGDPTLRLHPVAPPTNLRAGLNGQGVILSWQAAADTELAGYHVYRSDQPSGPFERLTATPITGTAYTDAASTNGGCAYMVRAIKLETSGSGTYFNASQGAFVQVNSQLLVPLVSCSAVIARAWDLGKSVGQFRLVRQGPTNSELKVRFAVGGSAIAGKHYAALSTNLAVPAGVTNVFLPVEPVSGALADSTNEQLAVVLTLLPGIGYQIGQPAEATVFLVRSGVEVNVTAQADTAVAGSSEDGVLDSPGYFTFSRGGDLSRPLIVNYSVTGTALSGIDYQSLSNSVAFPAGASLASVWVSPLFASTNWHGERVKTVVVTLQNGPGYVSGPAKSATVMLLNRDWLPTIEIVATVAVAREADLSPGIFTIKRSGNLTNTTTVVLSQPNGFGSYSKAVYGTDYVLAPPYVDYHAYAFILPYGFETTNVVLIPKDNSLLDYDKTVALSLESGLYKIGYSNSATITIQDSNSNRDKPMVRVRSPGYALGYAYMATGQAGAINIQRSGGTNELAVRLNYAGTAVNGVNYRLMPDSAVFPTGTNSLTLQIVPIRNSLGEGDKTVQVSLEDSPDYLLDPTQSTGSVTIVDISYNIWLRRYFGTNVSDPLIVGPDADPDHDGYCNFLEFVFGMDPTHPDLTPPTGWPKLTLQTSNNTTTAFWSITMRPTAMDFYLDTTCTTNLTAAAWRHSSRYFLPQPLRNNPDGTITYQLFQKISNTSPTNLFMRLQLLRYGSP